MKKKACLLMFILLLGGCFGFEPKCVMAEEIILHEGKNTVHISAGETVYGKFIPTRSQSYEIYTIGDTDTYGILYNANRETIDSDDDGGEDSNFLISENLISGKEYYIGVRFYNQESEGTINLVIEKYICSHSWTNWDYIYGKHKKANCTEAGTETRICERCGEIETKTVPALGHSWNGSYLEQGAYVSPGKPDKLYKYCDKCNTRKAVSTISASLKTSGKNVNIINNTLDGNYTTYTYSADKANYVVLPVKLSAAGHIEIYFSSIKGIDKVYFVPAKALNNFYTINENCYASFSAEGPYTSLSWKLKAGTYYIFIETKGLVRSSAMIKTRFFNKSSNALKSGKWAGGYGRPWHKIVLSKSGFLKVDYEKVSGPYEIVYFSLYDKNKKAAPYNQQYRASEGASYFPVKKGTYYLRIDDSDFCYKLKYTFTAVPTAKNYKLSRAKALSKNRKTNIVVYTADPKAKWNRYYKIKITKRQKIRINVYEHYRGYYDILNSSKKSIDVLVDGTGKVAHITSRKVLEPGTYYISFKITFSSALRKHSAGNVSIFSWE